MHSKDRYTMLVSITGFLFISVFSTVQIQLIKYLKSQIICIYMKHGYYNSFVSLSSLKETIECYKNILLCS